MASKVQATCVFIPGTGMLQIFKWKKISSIIYLYVVVYRYYCWPSHHLVKPYGSGTCTRSLHKCFYVFSATENITGYCWKLHQIFSLSLSAEVVTCEYRKIERKRAVVGVGGRERGWMRAKQASYSSIHHSLNFVNRKHYRICALNI